MFKVPGWSLPAASLKTQTQATAETPGQENTQTAQKVNGKGKRKRKDPQENTVTNDNVAELFRQLFEDGEPMANEHGVTTTTTTITKGDRHADEASNETREQDDVQQKKRKTLKEKKREKRARLAAGADSGEALPSSDANPELEKTADHIRDPPPVAVQPSKLTALQSNMQQKLISSRFRHLNQVLYTTPSDDSKTLFSKNPGFFSEYHEGFRRQVQAWPENPVEGFITWIKVRGGIPVPGPPHRRRGDSRHGNTQTGGPKIEQENHPLVANMGPLPRHPHSGTCTIADLGCGDGQLAKVLFDAPPKPPLAKRLKLHIRSFDLAANSPHIEVADISSLPVQSGTVDVAIFCLALMGTNWIGFIEEAYRILKWKGECWISEVSSRFNSAALSKRNKGAARNTKLDNRKGQKSAEEKIEDDFTKVDEDGPLPQASTDVSAFIQVLSRRGFELMGEPETNNKMFVRMRFIKSRKPISGKEVRKAPVERPGWEPKKRFIDEEPISVDDEAKVLKPCVYKQR